MIYFDTHAHLDDKRFDSDRESLIESFPQEGIGKVVNAGANRETTEAGVLLAEAYPYIYASVGTHPHDSKDFTDVDYDRYKELAAHPKVVAVGEIGLDYYYDNSERDIQRKVFIRQMELAEEVGLPVIIHSREAMQETYDILESFENVVGIMHCYSGSPEMAQRFIDLGYYISLAGPVTFQNALKPKEVGKAVPLDRLLIETDAPYLTPHPYRGKRNDPTKVKFVAEEIARLKNLPLEEVVQASYDNAMKVFGLCE